MKMPFVPMSVFAAREKVGIFISYRRADTAGYAGRIVDQLKSRFGDQVFFDVDSIKPGLNFHQVIEDTLAKCGAVVVLIGKKWLERDEAMPRFGDEHDVITQEIRLTMQSKLPIVPVLVDGASMPPESIFPPAFASLSSLNAIDLRHTSFDRDVQALTEQLLDLLGGANETAIERFALKTFGPLFGNSIARISSYFILLAVCGALYGLTELAGAAFLIFQNGIRSLFSASIFDPETARLQAIWTAALAALLFGFLGRRSIRWWRQATIVMWVSLAEIILAVALAAVYVVQVPEARIMDLFDNKKILASP